MITIICAALAVLFAVVLSWVLVENRALRRELADMTDDRDGLRSRLESWIEIDRNLDIGRCVEERADLNRRLNASEMAGADLAQDRDAQASRAKAFERLMNACKDEIISRDSRLDSLWNRVILAEADADRLAPFVVNFIADIEAVSAQLGTLDKKPLDLSDEREAIHLHQEAVKLRTK